MKKNLSHTFFIALLCVVQTTFCTQELRRAVRGVDYIVINGKCSCEHCHRIFASLSGVREHIACHHLRSFPCTSCGRFFPTYSKLTFHACFKKTGQSNNETSQVVVASADAESKRAAAVVAVTQTGAGKQELFPHCAKTYSRRHIKQKPYDRLTKKKLWATLGQIDTSADIPCKDTTFAGETVSAAMELYIAQLLAAEPKRDEQ